MFALDCTYTHMCIQHTHTHNSTYSQYKKLSVSCFICINFTVFHKHCVLMLPLHSSRWTVPISVAQQPYVANVTTKQHRFSQLSLDRTLLKPEASLNSFRASPPLVGTWRELWQSFACKYDPCNGRNSQMLRRKCVSCFEALTYYLFVVLVLKQQ